MAQCAFCSTKTKEILDFGNVALAGGFLKASEFSKEKKYPLHLHFCPKCFLVQLAERIDPDILFKDYFYFSSQIESVRKHFIRYAKTIKERLKFKSVLEIGCNDGFLLGQLVNHVKCIGIDPAKNVIDSIQDARLHLINDYFNEKTAAEIVKEHGKQDLIIANNVFAHVGDIMGLTRAVKSTLAENGTFVVEVHHLGKMIKGLQYDWIYHEHLYYYSCLSLQKHLNKHGLTIYDVERVSLHGGSMRYYICHEGERKQRILVGLLMLDEKLIGLHLEETFHNFADKVRKHKLELIGLLDRLKVEGRTIAGYGASGRANTIMQWCGINGFQLSYIIDDAPAKAGFYTPGSHLPIYHRESPHATEQEYFLILAWPYAKEISQKIGGKKIIPLPEVTIQ